MRRDVCWDSSAIVALLDKDDADHRAAVEIAARVAREHAPCFLTNYVEAETHALLLRKLGRVLAREWLCAAGLPVVRALPGDEAKARALLLRHADKDWSYCDAITFAVMEARDVRRAFAFDRHFRQYGRLEVLVP